MSGAIVLAALIVIFVPLFRVGKDNDPGERGCLGNYNQMGLAMLQYAQDYDDMFPPGVRAERAAANVPLDGAGWGRQIWPYVKDLRYYRCPDDAPSPGIRFSNACLMATIATSRAANAA